MEYYSSIKKNKIPAFFATWMDLETIMLSEVSHTMRHQHQMLSLTCGIWKRTDWTSLQNRYWLTDIENLWSLEETVWWVVGGAWALGWKSCGFRLLWSLYNYRCDKFLWEIYVISNTCMLWEELVGDGWVCKILVFGFHCMLPCTELFTSSTFHIADTTKLS